MSRKIRAYKDPHQPQVQATDYFTYTLSWGTDYSDLSDQPIQGPVGHNIDQPYANRTVLLYVSISSTKADQETNDVVGWYITIPKTISSNVSEFTPIMLTDYQDWLVTVQQPTPNKPYTRLSFSNQLKKSLDSVVCLVTVQTATNPVYDTITIQERNTSGDDKYLQFPTMVIPGVFEFTEMYFTLQKEANSQPVAEIAPGTPFFVQWKGNNIADEQTSAYTLELSWKETTCLPSSPVEDYPYVVDVTAAGASGEQQRYPQSDGLTTNHDVTFILVAKLQDLGSPPRYFQTQRTLRVTQGSPPIPTRKVSSKQITTQYLHFRFSES